MPGAVVLHEEHEADRRDDEVLVSVVVQIHEQRRARILQPVHARFVGRLFHRAVGLVHVKLIGQPAVVADVKIVQSVAIGIANGEPVVAVVLQVIQHAHPLAPVIQSALHQRQIGRCLPQHGLRHFLKERAAIALHINLLVIRHRQRQKRQALGEFPLHQPVRGDFPAQFPVCRVDFYPDPGRKEIAGFLHVDDFHLRALRFPAWQCRGESLQRRLQSPPGAASRRNAPPHCHSALLIHLLHPLRPQRIRCRPFAQLHLVQQLCFRGLYQKRCQLLQPFPRLI